MSSPATEIAENYRKDRRYRAWFKEWWSLDFSIEGRKSSLKQSRHVPKVDFADRTWPLGWSPPHDLDGNINPNFYLLSLDSHRHHFWQYIANALDGSFIFGEHADLIPRSVSDLSFAYFYKDFRHSAEVNEFRAERAFCNGSVKVDTARGASLILPRISIRGELSLNISRASSCDLSRAFVGGGISCSGKTSLVAHRARVLGDIVTTGTISANGLVANDIQISGGDPDNQSLALPSAKVRHLRIGGHYTTVLLEGLSAENIHISGDIKEFRGQRLMATTVNITGSISDLIIDDCVISGGIVLESLRCKLLSASRAKIDHLDAERVTAEQLDISDISVKSFARYVDGKVASILRGPRARFTGSVSFCRSVMHGPIMFSGAHFSEGLDIRVGSGTDVSSNQSAGRIGVADFSQVYFGPGTGEVCVNFSSRTMTEEANFEGACFVGIPEFYECDFHENVNFHNARFVLIPPSKSTVAIIGEVDWRGIINSLRSAATLKEKLSVAASRLSIEPFRRWRQAENRRFSSYERAYNALRQRFADVGNAKYERQFHTLELRSRRRRWDSEVPSFERLLSWAYDISSGYGRSISRPLVILLAVWIGFSVIYFVTAGITSGTSAIEAAVFSGRQIVKPFSVWGRDLYLSAAPFFSGSEYRTSTWIAALLSGDEQEAVYRAAVVRLLATVESVIGLLLIFLSGLAIRRAFGLS